MTQVPKVSYNIKSMVAARLLAESTVLFILCLLPLSLFLVPQLARAEWTFKLIICLLSPLGALALTAAALLPFRVRLDSAGIRTVAVLRAVTVEWERIHTMRLVSKWGFRIYELLDDKNSVVLFFPLWFKNLGRLIESVRGRLPDRGRVRFEGERVFRQDIAVLIIQVMKGSGQLIFLAVFWGFFVSYRATAGTRSEDLLILLLAGTIFSAMAMWKFYLLLTMPREVRLDGTQITCKGPLLKATMSTSEIRSVQASNFLQPEGLLLKAGNQKILIGAFLESFDELEESLQLLARKQGPGSTDDACKGGGGSAVKEEPSSAHSDAGTGGADNDAGGAVEPGNRPQTHG